MVKFMQPIVSQNVHMKTKGNFVFMCTKDKRIIIIFYNDIYLFFLRKEEK